MLLKKLLCLGKQKCFPVMTIVNDFQSDDMKREHVHFQPHSGHTVFQCGVPMIDKLLQLVSIT